MIPAFHVNPADNVATVLADAEGTVEVVGSAAPAVALAERIPANHKVALADIPAGAPIIKYGVRIGHASQSIARGAWVHLHNLASDFDERSGTLDLHSGAPTDTRYE